MDGIRTFYGETQALFDVSLQVSAGEVVALLGATGAGKTTTLRSILGLTPARQGTIRFDGRDVTHQSTHAIARAGVAWVPEERRVVPSLTVQAQSDDRREAHKVSTLDDRRMLRDLYAHSNICSSATAKIFPAVRCRWSRFRARCSAARGWC